MFEQTFKNIDDVCGKRLVVPHYSLPAEGASNIFGLAMF
jgi:hypothetical protein